MARDCEDDAAIFAHADLAYAVAPFLEPVGWSVGTFVSRSWRERLIARVSNAGGVRPWLATCSTFTEDLCESSLQLCRAAIAQWIDQRQYSVAFLLPSPAGTDEALRLAIEQLERLPGNPALPPLPARYKVDRQGDSTGWTVSQEQGYDGSLSIPQRISKELRRHWETAYLSYDGDYDEPLRAECMRLVATWCALWSIARGSCKRQPFEGSLTSLSFCHSSLRGSDTWKLTLASLGAVKGETGQQWLHAVVFGWWERRQMG
eukprot:TRINITY_DN52603_c0_g2_i1.p1 TRINITY_DN52603_c0_g2~~TRINITY_DN52603_c0_g2_i1.p1  ORF type:complete len:261 (-),score=9.96 TRINITY_DN52603_c0_g2_i1:426-1208(-)